MCAGRQYGEDRLEAACSRAVGAGGFSLKSVRSILDKGGKIFHPVTWRRTTVARPGRLTQCNIARPAPSVRGGDSWRVADIEADRSTRAGRGGTGAVQKNQTSNHLEPPHDRARIRILC